MFRGLTDHAPLRFSGRQRATWERIYLQAEELAAGGYWGKEGATWPAHVATKVGDDLWTRAGRVRSLPRPGLMPPPGDMISIGFAVDAQYFDPRASMIRTVKFQLPKCLWSERLRAVIVFTDLQIPPATIDPYSLPDLLALYRKWHDGKMPKNGGSKVSYEAPLFTSVYPCIAETYRSDKFDKDYEYVDYVHHNDPGAAGQHGPLLYAGPTCVMIRGGRLALTSGGLIH